MQKLVINQQAATQITLMIVINNFFFNFLHYLITNSKAGFSELKCYLSDIKQR